MKKFAILLISAALCTMLGVSVAADQPQVQPEAHDHAGAMVGGSCAEMHAKMHGGAGHAACNEAGGCCGGMHKGMKHEGGGACAEMHGGMPSDAAASGVVPTPDSGAAGHTHTH